MVKITEHAKTRCQQRGIKSVLLPIILEFGKKKRLPGGATGYLLRKKDKNLLVNECKRIIQILNHSTGVQIVKSPDGLILTIYRKR